MIPLPILPVHSNPPFLTPQHFFERSNERAVKGTRVREARKVITWADLASFWPYSLSTCFSRLFACNERVEVGGAEWQGEVGRKGGWRGG